MKRWSPIPPVSDREFYERIAASGYGKMMLEEAEAVLTLPLPAPTEELYRQSFATRDRARYETQILELNQHSRTLAIALLLKPERKFIEKFTALLDIYSQMKSWLLPAHDRYPHTTIPMANIDEIITTTDLVSLDIASGMSIAIGALESILPADSVAKFKAKAAKLVIEPITLIARNRRPYNYWMILPHNWNAVCYCNTILTFLASDVPESDRKMVVDFALARIKYFINGFNVDGYCQEGPGYFGYGFGHYTYLSWALYEASGHKLNLFDSDRVKQIAAFPEKMMLSETQLPLFCDCNPKIFIRRDLMEIRDYLVGKSDKVNFLPPRMEQTGRPQDLTLLQQLMLIGFSSSENLRDIKLNEFDAFPETGVFVWRGDEFSFCIKGGHNREFHNHNDVGNFVLVQNDKTLLIDAGQPRYNMDSFHSGKKGKPNKLRTSYGHQVPVCDGNLQLSGFESRGIVKHYDENGATLDITTPYRQSCLKTLLRKVDFDREKGQVTVSDTANFAEEAEFAVPLVTFGKWEEVEPGTLRIFRENEWEFFCKVSASGEYSISDELIDDDILFDEPVRRILFTFKDKAKDFKISTTFILEDKQ